MTVVDPTAPRVLREDDPDHARLLAEGWEVVATSWGARLTLPDDADLTPYLDRVAAAEQAGFQVRALTPVHAASIREVDAATASDYPETVASHHTPLPDELASLLADGSCSGFGAFGFDGSLAGFTLGSPRPDRWEVDRTAVAAGLRRRGLAEAVKAASILATHAVGVRRWGTGGAGVNAVSLAMNRALGFELEPLWYTLAPGR